MRTSIFAICLAVVVLAPALSTSAAASGGGGGPFLEVNLSPYRHYYGGEVIEIPPGDVETLYVRISESGGGSSAAPANLGEGYRVEFRELHWEMVSGPGALPSVEVDFQIGPGTYMEPWNWYPFATVTIDGEPSTTINIWAELEFDTEPIIQSNTITKHITPEPSSLLALGTGMLGVGGLLLRRRRH